MIIFYDFLVPKLGAFLAVQCSGETLCKTFNPVSMVSFTCVTDPLCTRGLINGDNGWNSLLKTYQTYKNTLSKRLKNNIFSYQYDTNLLKL